MRKEKNGNLPGYRGLVSVTPRSISSLYRGGGSKELEDIVFEFRRGGCDLLSVMMVGGVKGGFRTFSPCCR